MFLVSHFLACFYRAQSSLLVATSLVWFSFLRFGVSHCLMLLHVQKVLVCTHMFSQKMTYDVTVSVSSLKLVAAASKILQSMNSKHSCNSSCDYFYFLTVLTTCSGVFHSCLSIGMRWIRPWSESNMGTIKSPIYRLYTLRLSFMFLHFFYICCLQYCTQTW